MQTQAQYITAHTNPQFKRWLAGQERPRAMTKNGSCLLEGIHLCQTWLQQQGAPERLIYGAHAAAHPEVKALIAQVSAPLFALAAPLAQRLSQVENGIPIWFEIAIPQPTFPSQLTGDWLWLDQLQDPGNVGTILRTAAAVGIRQVLALQGTAALWSSKVLRAAMGAHAYLQLWESDWQTVVQHLGQISTKQRLNLWATSSHAQTSLYASDLRLPSIWIFGHEGRGVRAEILAHTQALAIPQPGGMESLNVAAAVAVCLYEQLRQRQCE